MYTLRSTPGDNPEQTLIYHDDPPLMRHCMAYQVYLRCIPYARVQVKPLQRKRRRVLDAARYAN